MHVTIQVLPENMLTEIFFYVSDDCLKTISLVCKSWNRIVSDIAFWNFCCRKIARSEGFLSKQKNSTLEVPRIKAINFNPRFEITKTFISVLPTIDSLVTDQVTCLFCHGDTVYLGNEDGSINQFKVDDSTLTPLESLKHDEGWVFAMDITPQKKLISLHQGFDFVRWHPNFKKDVYYNEDHNYFFSDKDYKQSFLFKAISEDVLLLNHNNSIVAFNLPKGKVLGGLINSKTNDCLKKCATWYKETAFCTFGTSHIFHFSIQSESPAKEQMVDFQNQSNCFINTAPSNTTLTEKVFLEEQKTAICALEAHEGRLCSLSEDGTLCLINIQSKSIIHCIKTANATCKSHITFPNFFVIQILSNLSCATLIYLFPKSAESNQASASATTRSRNGLSDLVVEKFTEIKKFILG